MGGIPGLLSYYPNSYVNTMKGSLWSDLLHLLGKSGERIMLDLVLSCSIFVTVAHGTGNYLQLSGKS